MAPCCLCSLELLSAGVPRAGILAREGNWSECVLAVLLCLCCLCVPWFPVALPLCWSMGVECGWDIPVHGRSKARIAVLLLPSAQLSQALVKLCTQMAQVCHVSPLPQLVKATPFTQLEICPKRCPRLCSYLGDIPSSVRGMCGMRLEVLLS